MVDNKLGHCIDGLPGQKWKGGTGQVMGVTERRGMYEVSLVTGRMPPLMGDTKPTYVYNYQGLG
jgi:hypothetical protein